MEKQRDYLLGSPNPFRYKCVQGEGIRYSPTVLTQKPRQQAIQRSCLWQKTIPQNLRAVSQICWPTSRGQHWTSCPRSQSVSPSIASCKCRPYLCPQTPRPQDKDGALTQRSPVTLETAEPSLASESAPPGSKAGREVHRCLWLALLFTKVVPGWAQWMVTCEWRWMVKCTMNK